MPSLDGEAVPAASDPDGFPESESREEQTERGRPLSMWWKVNSKKIFKVFYI